jgi:hypothetical protein
LDFAYCHSGAADNPDDWLFWSHALLCFAVLCCALLCLLVQGQYRRAHEVKLSTDALYESELAATHQAWELVVELKKNKLNGKQQGK